ncbi:hypothetical protein CEXT_132011 [Caerostris extrusa]|uniref:Uncharacterized protein n=1 Tax=Caerostris extrusa TaxID=172846 RepID=A0AAV4Y2P6_CAEEX|nr:hypothetical protein CEXT_132011 [Caerostris extrusa]
MSGGPTNCLAHNDFLPSSAAGFFPDFPITAIRLCKWSIRPYFWSRCPLLTTWRKSHPGLSPVFIYIELNRGQARRKRVAAFFTRVRLIKTFEEFSQPFPVTAPYGDQRQNELGWKTVNNFKNILEFIM